MGYDVTVTLDSKQLLELVAVPVLATQLPNYTADDISTVSLSVQSTGENQLEAAVTFHMKGSG